MQRSKTLPKGAATFLADCLARDSYLLTQHNRDDVAAELLAIDRAAVPTAVSELPAGSDNHALGIALALVLGSLEARLCGVSTDVHCSLVQLGLGGSASGAANLRASASNRLGFEHRRRRCLPRRGVVGLRVSASVQLGDAGQPLELASVGCVVDGEHPDVLFVDLEMPS